MMNPAGIVFLNELVEVYKSNKIIKFLHIPVQSGSDKVLREMGRKHDVEKFKRIVRKFRKEIPEINISTDIIVGYPTETEEDFTKSLNLVKEIRPEVLNISRFSARPGTKAANLKQLKTEEIKNRSRRLTREFERTKANTAFLCRINKNN